LNIGPKDLPVKSTEDLLIGILKPIVFLLYGYKDQQVARNLLTYRYNQLDKAIENAQNNLGFKNGAALYPMVTMNGRNATMNGKSHMKKSIETGDCFCYF
jgi:trehalose/maltose hydrolase-like predicted phosphorylase